MYAFEWVGTALGCLCGWLCVYMQLCENEGVDVFISVDVQWCWGGGWTSVCGRVGETEHEQRESVCICASSLSLSLSRLSFFLLN